MYIAQGKFWVVYYSSMMLRFVGFQYGTGYYGCAYALTKISLMLINLGGDLIYMVLLRSWIRNCHSVRSWCITSVDTGLEVAALFTC